MKKWVVFDLDGTLNRTDLYAVDAHQQAMRELGYPVLSREAVIAGFGGRSWDYVKVMIPGADEATEQRYLKRVSELETVYMQNSCGPFDGVPEMLARLHEAGYGTAVCSNASLRYISMVLGAIGIADLIDEIQFLEPGLSKAQTLRKLLERVQPAGAVMVGDRCFDQEAAHENGLPFIGCAYGFCPAEMAGADVVVQAPDEIFDAVCRMLA